MQLGYGSIAPNILSEPLSVRAKPLIVVGKEHDLAPSRELTTHDRLRAIREVDATFLEQVFRDFGRADEDNIVSE
jgi:hypothetical protein